MSYWTELSYMAILGSRDVGKIGIDLGEHVLRHKGDDLQILFQVQKGICPSLEGELSCFLGGVSLSSKLHDPWLFPQGDSSLSSILRATYNRH